jgi:hypothetical protein
MFVVKEESVLANKFPELTAEWDFEKNGELKPTNVSYGSDKKAWWVCNKCHEHYESSISNRVHGRACPFCSGQKVRNWNCLAVQKPDIAKQWHPTKNDNLTANDVTCGSDKEAWWECPNCHENYILKVSHVTMLGQGCPYCSGKAVCNWNCLATKFPDIAKEWHPTKNGNITHHNVTFGSKKMVWWLCLKCKEYYKAIITNRTNLKHGCPYCSGHKVCHWNCLATKRPDIAKQWHPTKNGNLTPKDVTCNHIKNKIWWICSYCGKDTKLSCVQAIRNKNIICSECNLYHQEEQTREILEKLTGKKFPKTRNIPWFFNSKTKRKYEADGYCAELNIIFEHQGPQHCRVYKQFHPNGMQDFFYQLYKDAERYRLCKENNCLLICTYYDQAEEEIEKYIRKTLIENGKIVQ